MRVTLNPTSGQPLYLQLVQQIRHAIETGVLGAGEALPALRTFAQNLVVSPNTIVKAYEVLERDGWLETRHGSGVYVSGRRGMQPRADRLRSAQERVHALVARLQADGLSDDELWRLFEAELLFQAPGVRKKP